MRIILLTFIAIGSIIFLTQCSTPKNITILVTSNINGSIRDCGCGGVNLGGFPRLKTFINSVKKTTDSLLLIDTGDSFPSFDYPEKSSLISYLMDELDYNFILKADQENQLGNFNQKVDYISFFIPKENTTPFLTETKRLIDSKILIFHGDSIQFEEHWSELKHYPIVLLSHSQEVKNYTKNGIRFIQTGNDTEFIGRIDLTDQFELINAQIVPLKKEIQENIHLKKFIDAFFKSSEHITKLGSSFSKQNCQSCHQSEFKLWKETRHAKAMQTLTDLNKNTDKECVTCHSSELILRNSYVQKIPNIQCVACHQGSNLPHNKKFKSLIAKSSIETCIKCHTSKNSPHFNYEKYMNKIKHWN